MILHRITSPKSTILLLSCLLLNTACTTAPDRQTAESRLDATAQSHLEQGDYAAAAREFLRLAGTSPDKALSYRLEAVAAFLEANALEQAGELLGRIRIPAEQQQLRLEQQLLQSRLALYRGEPEQALALLPGAIPVTADNSQLADYHELRARIFESRNDYARAVHERITRAQYLTTTGAHRENNRQLWDSLGQLAPETLQELAGAGPPQLTAWVELARIRQEYLSQPEQLEAALEMWQRTHSNHPAIPEITTRILTTSHKLQTRPETIALLLPFTGPYKRPAEAIRDGFLTAWYAAEDYQPAIHIYDTDALTIIEDYEKAVAEGAELVVGPLEKSAIRTLRDSGQTTVTTLALNQVDNDEPHDYAGAGMETEDSGELLQFALSPEHEVRQIAHRGVFEGFNRSLMITPDNQWGRRLSETFSAEWRSLGGTLLEAVTYNPAMQDFISPVQELLNIDSSEARIRRLQQRLSRNIEATSRTRKDADFIYMAAIPVNARQIVPQFRFFRVDTMPIYSSSHIYTGSPDPQLDADMNGVEFTDIPWVLRPEKRRPSIQQYIHENWSTEAPAYSRLYAFGVDAFRIIPKLGEMALLDRYRYSGETGELSITDNGYIQRQLQWAKFVNGRPVLLDTGDRLGQGSESLPER